MIIKLTEQQQKELKKYKDNWTNNGLSTQEIDKEKAKKTINALYKDILKKEIPRKIIYCRSPLEIWKAICLYKYLIHKLKNNNYNSRKEIKNIDYWEKIIIKVNNEIKDEIEPKILKEIWEEIKIEIKDEINNEFLKEIINDLKENKYLLNFVWPYLDGKFNASYFSFYDYMNACLGIKYSNLKKFNIYKDLSQFELIYPFKNICFISENFIEINRNENKQLHADKKPALKYKDGFCLWRLNGVKVSKELVLMDAKDIDPNIIFKEKNVEIRREIIRKVGIENIFKKIKHEIIEQNEVYELLKIPLGENIEGMYLKMKNPSIDAIHIEGVPLECDSIEKALAWRNYEWEVGQEFKGYTKPRILT